MPSKTKPPKNAAIAAKTAALPQVPKHERGFTGFDDKIVALYARGMTVREIQGFLAERYGGTEVSAEFIGSASDAVMAEVTAWRNRSRCTRWCSLTRRGSRSARRRWVQQQQGAQGSGGGLRADLHGPSAEAARQALQETRSRPLGPEVAHRRDGLAQGLGASHPVLRLQPGGTARDLLALRNITTDRGRAAKEGREAMNQFAKTYGNRFTRVVV